MSIELQHYEEISTYINIFFKFLKQLASITFFFITCSPLQSVLELNGSNQYISIWSFIVA